MYFVREEDGWEGVLYWLGLHRHQGRLYSILSSRGGLLERGHTLANLYISISTRSSSSKTTRIYVQTV